MRRMKKLATTLFLIAVALASVAAIKPSRASGTATISVDSATQQFSPEQVGDTIQVNIDVSNVQNLWAWDITNLKFDPGVLNLTQVSEGPFLKQAGQTLFLWTSQSAVAISKGDIPDMSCTLLEISSANGSGVIATLTFQVVSLGTSQINFTQPTLEDPNQGQIAFNAINTNVNVVPEFSSWAILMLLMMASTISVLLLSKKAKRGQKPL